MRGKVKMDIYPESKRCKTPSNAIVPAYCEKCLDDAGNPCFLPKVVNASPLSDMQDPFRTPANQKTEMHAS